MQIYLKKISLQINKKNIKNVDILENNSLGKKSQGNLNPAGFFQSKELNNN